MKYEKLQTSLYLHNSEYFDYYEISLYLKTAKQIRKGGVIDSFYYRKDNVLSLLDLISY